MILIINRGNDMPKQKTNDEFVKEVLQRNKKIKKVIGNYIDAFSKVKVEYSPCGHVYEARACNLLNGSGCPVCKGKVVIEGINDLATTRPDLVCYLTNVDDAKKYTCSSNVKVSCTCPTCNSKKMCSLNMLDRRGFTCLVCSDGVSFPNKMGRSFLEQLPIDNIIHEYVPSWAKQYRYDSYFEYNNHSYLLEMDGGQHKTKEQQNIDTKKDIIAKDNGAIVIRIDAEKSDFDYIKINLENSLFSELFDLSVIDWNRCFENTKKSIMVEVCNDYKKHNDNNIKSIAKRNKISPASVYRYLINGTKIGLCNYKNPQQKPIEVYDKEFSNLLYSFASLSECARFLNLQFQETYCVGSIRYAALNNHYYKGFNFKYI